MWSSLSNLGLLDVSGTLPEEWSEMGSLQQLNLAGNSLYSTLPTGWGAGLTSLVRAIVDGETRPRVALLSAFPFSAFLRAALAPAPAPSDAASRPRRPSRTPLTRPAGLAAGGPRMAAMAFQPDLGSPTLLSTNWTSGTDPCADAWLGVSCQSSAGPVTGLDLAYGSYGTTGASLPPSISFLRDLKTLNLDSAGLIGPLPGSWSVLTALTSMQLASNALSLSLPSEWSTLGRLVTINLGFNQLTGDIPTAWDILPPTTTRLIFTSNSAMCGALPSALATPATRVAKTGTGLGVACPRPPPPPPSPPSVGGSLYKLRSAADPDSWPAAFAGWTEGSDPCTGWSGVQCTNGSPVVVDVSYANIQGPALPLSELQPSGTWKQRGTPRWLMLYIKPSPPPSRDTLELRVRVRIRQAVFVTTVFERLWFGCTATGRGSPSLPLPFPPIFHGVPTCIAPSHSSVLVPPSDYEPIFRKYRFHPIFWKSPSTRNPFEALPSRHQHLPKAARRALLPRPPAIPFFLSFRLPHY
eukprot:gene49-12864_t